MTSPRIRARKLPIKTASIGHVRSTQKGRASRAGSGQVASRGISFEVAISVDGKPLPLKEFLHDLLGGAINGMVTALHGVDNPRRIEVSIRLNNAGKT